MVGGSVPVFDEIIISTSLMDKIENIDVHSGVVQTQAGVILEKLDMQLGEHGLMAPLDLGAKGSCQIGGNVAANAGGKVEIVYTLFESENERQKIEPVPILGNIFNDFTLEISGFH